LEYMAAGRSVVATDVGANGQLLRGGELGLLVPPGDEAELAKGIGRLVADPTEAGRRGAAARRHVADHYSREAMRERFEAFYRRLCA
jgi:glycosyltransferase involved in cell wall biosynthesis